MKKLLLALPLLLAVVMVGCKKDQKDDPTKIQSLTLRPEKATIAEGGDISLTVIAQPAGLKGEYTWASSDTTVAAVDKDGNVYGVSAGTAYITVTEAGGQTAQSEIRVTSYLESFSFGQAMVHGWNPADSAGLPILDVESSSGASYKAYAMPIDFMVFSEGFYVNESGKSDGAEEALVITMPSYMYWAPANLNGGKGAMFCLGQWKILKDSSEYYTKVGEPGVYTDGVLTNVLKAMDAYNTQNYTDFNNYLKLAGDAVTGTSLTNWNYSCAEDDPTNCGYSLSYVPDAILEEALFDLSSGTDGSSRYMVLLDYCKFTFRQLNSSTYWGVDATYDKENDKLIVNDRSKLYVSEPITMEFGEQPEKINANKSNLVAFPESILPSVEVQENIARQIKEGKIRVINNFKRK